MAQKTISPAPKSGGNRPRFKFVTLWKPSTIAIGGLVVGGFALIGLAALNFGQAATDGDQQEQQAKLRIMPLGDSLTDGAPTYAGAYRPVLYQKLVGQGGREVDYVGSQSNGDRSLPDKDHEGHAGWRISQLNDNVVGWLQNYQPNVVLLHAGTSDLVQGANAKEAAEQLDKLVSTITSTRTDARLIISTLGPLNVGSGWGSQVLRDYNAAIPSIVSKYQAKGYDISYVDMARQAGLALGEPDIADGVHPTAGGYGKMADAWHDVIEK